jgi:hypothetical protein
MFITSVNVRRLVFPNYYNEGYKAEHSSSPRCYTTNGIRSVNMPASQLDFMGSFVHELPLPFDTRRRF